MKQTLVILLVLSALFAVMAFRLTSTADPLNGAWQREGGGTEEVLLFMDGYLTHTTYDKGAKKFIQSRGGDYSLEDGRLSVSYEFDTADSTQVGNKGAYTASVKGGRLLTNLSGKEQGWKRIDDGNAPLAGLWAITARQQEGKLEPIHQRGTRKTIKILTATRFQWAAIDPGTKQFMGTGGGTYTFKDGKYTEHIEFFSRDSSRVGASLSFDGKLESGNWHHSGLSSRGTPIYEVWSRRK